MKTVLLALFLIGSVAWAQDPSVMANQIMQQQLMDQSNQWMIQQMQAMGANTYVLNIPPPWNSWKVASRSYLDFSAKSGVVKSGTQVRIKWRAGDYAAVYYTLDGWSPTLASTRYTGPIAINGPAHLQAIGVDWDCFLGYPCKVWRRSATVDAHYNVNSKSADAPTVVTDGLLRAGTVLKLKTEAEARSNSAKPGDKVSLTLDQDVMEGNTIVIPKGTSADAVLTQVAPPAGPHRPGLLVVEVRSLQSSRATIKLLGSETMVGKTGQKSEEAIIKPDMTLYAKVAADTKLQP